MSLLNSFIALVIVLSVIGLFGYMTYKSAMKGAVERTEMHTSWLTAAFVLWLIALSTPYTDRVSALLIVGGPIAFFFGFTYQVIRQTIKKNFT